MIKLRNSFINKLTFILFLILSSCSGIKVINKAVEHYSYRKPFLIKFEKIKEIYKSGDREKALVELKEFNSIEKKALLSAEKSKVYNLIGVIYFLMEDYTQSIENFNSALLQSKEDVFLTGQIHLNISSLYYKLNEWKKSYDSILGINEIYLEKRDLKRYYKLRYVLAKYFKNRPDMMNTLVKSLFHYQK